MSQRDERTWLGSHSVKPYRNTQKIKVNFRAGSQPKLIYGIENRQRDNTNQQKRFFKQKIHYSNHRWWNRKYGKRNPRIKRIAAYFHEKFVCRQQDGWFGRVWGISELIRFYRARRSWLKGLSIIWIIDWQVMGNGVDNHVEERWGRMDAKLLIS